MTDYQDISDPQKEIVAAAMEMLKSVGYRACNEPGAEWPMANEEAYMRWVASLVHTAYQDLSSGGEPVAAYVLACELSDKARALLGQTERRVILIFPVPMHDPEMKDTYAMASKLIAGAMGAKATAFIADAYVRSATGEDVDMENLGPVSEHPDREEAVILIAESAEFDSVVAQIGYSRDDGKIVSVKAPDVRRLGSDGRLVGRFSGAVDHVFYAHDVAAG